MARVDRRQLLMFLGEAEEAYRAAKRIVEEYGLEEFLASLEARYALRYVLVLLVEALSDALTLILEAEYGLAPESYREAMLLAAEAGLLPYREAEALAGLAGLRNILVHRYWRVDDARLYRETLRGLPVVERVLGRLRRLAEALDSGGR